MDFVQFIPCLEALDETSAQPFTLTPRLYGKFLKELFPLWKDALIKGNYVSMRFFDNLVRLSAGEMPEMCGMCGKCSPQFVIEADGYTSYTNEWTRPYVRSYDISDYKTGRATHGHHPDKGVQPTLFAFGPDIEPGVVIDRAHLVDEAPTFARALGLEMKDVDGRVLEEIFKK